MDSVGYRKWQNGSGPFHTPQQHHLWYSEYMVGVVISNAASRYMKEDMMKDLISETLETHIPIRATMNVSKSFQSLKWW